MRLSTHLSDEQLLLAADGELPWRSAVAARLHLTFCPACRTRSSELKTAMGRYARVYREIFQQYSAAKERRHAPVYWPLSTAAWIAMAALAVLIWHLSSPSRHTIALVREGAIPRSDLTPGATRAIDRQRACALSDNVPDIPDALKRQVLREYGIDEAVADRYEIDFLITPALGGSESLRNLWPEPYFHRSWNAYVKDALEDHFHVMVCSGQMDLSTAQREIARNWVAAYQKHFHTRAPLPAISANLSFQRSVFSY
ncbi:MAG TPA: zf-HC2 domain-containing protein [Bryobacteraceae bacterium]